MPKSRPEDLKGLFKELNNKTVRDRIAQPPPFPAAVTAFLGRLSLLHGAPLSYLVPHVKLLERETLKFFYIDPQWIGALLGGALSVGRPNEIRVLLDKAAAGSFSAKIIAEARDVRKPAPNGTANPPIRGGATPTYAFTGFLMRSRILAGWPGLEVKAYRQQHQLAFLRLERPAADVLFGLADGELDSLEITQPPEGLHFATDPQSSPPMRDKGRGVLDVRKLAQQDGSAGLAARMMARPLRMTFSQGG